MSAYRNGNYVSKIDPNVGKPEICRVFNINIEDGSLSLVHTGKIFDRGSFVDISIEKNKRYIAPYNPIDQHIVSPIPITPNIIEYILGLSCNTSIFLGEKMESNEDTFTIGPLMLSNFTNNGCTVDYFQGGKQMRMNVSYVHDLQNLHHELTNKDLELNLEFRIGNIVKCGYYNAVITDIDHEGFHVQYPDWNNEILGNASKLSPIFFNKNRLLTEFDFVEIKNRYGTFFVHKSDKEQGLNGFYLEENKDDNGMRLIYTCKENNTIIPNIRELHKLQNLYYDKTGKHLDIK